MSRTQRYKKIEKRFASNIQNECISFFRALKLFFIKIFKIFDGKLTIMIVPHSQGKVINLQTNVFAMSTGILLIVGIVISFLYFNRKAISIEEAMTKEHFDNMIQSFKNIFKKIFKG